MSIRLMLIGACVALAACESRVDLQQGRVDRREAARTLVGELTAVQVRDQLILQPNYVNQFDRATGNCYVWIGTANEYARQEMLWDVHRHHELASCAMTKPPEWACSEIAGPAGRDIALVVTAKPISREQFLKLKDGVMRSGK
jgi:hypothetical protein